MRVLQFDDVHDTFEGQFIEVETVTHIVICGHRFWIIVNHHGTEPILSNRIKCLNTTPVKLYT